MKIIIFGGSGFVGQEICKKFQVEGHHVYVARRSNSEKNGQLKYGEVLTYTSDTITDLIQNVSENFKEDYAIINLSGESIQSGRWTESRKRKILESRVQTTKAIGTAIIQAKQKPYAWVNASAIGYYGDSLTKTFIEEDIPGKDFLAEVTKAWEEEVYKFQQHSRVITARIGMVLGKDGGALSRMLLPYQAYMGGKIGSGRQWISWVHIEDVANIFYFCVMNSQMEGPVNVTAPNPVIMDDFGVTLARVMHRPHWLPVPEFVLQCMLGEMAQIVIRGQKVMPESLLKHKFQFQFPLLETALTDVLEKE